MDLVKPLFDYAIPHAAVPNASSTQIIPLGGSRDNPLPNLPTHITLFATPEDLDS